MNAQNFGYDHLSTQSFDYMKNIYEKNLSLSEHVSIMNIFCHFSILIELAGTYILLELGSKSTYQISTNFKKKKWQSVKSYHHKFKWVYRKPLNCKNSNDIMVPIMVLKRKLYILSDCVQSKHVSAEDSTISDRMDSWRLFTNFKYFVSLLLLKSFFYRFALFYLHGTIQWVNNKHQAKTVQFELVM